MANDRNRFRIVGMNAGGGQPGFLNGPKLRRNTLMAIIQNQNPRIIFFQELRLVQVSVQNWLGAHYSYIGHPEAGIAYDTRFFLAKQLNYEDLVQQLQNFDNDFQPLPRMSALEITVITSGRKFICISWHGPHNIGPPARLRWFENLIAFLERLLRRYGLPLIVGGDFNIASNEVDDRTGALLRLEDCHVMNRVNGPIDFYIISNDLRLGALNFVDFPDGNAGFLDHRPLSTLLIIPDLQEVIIRDPLEYILRHLHRLFLG